MDLEMYEENLVAFQWKFVGVESLYFAFGLYVLNLHFAVAFEIPKAERTGKEQPISFRENAMMNENLFFYDFV